MNSKLFVVLLVLGILSVFFVDGAYINEGFTEFRSGRNLVNQTTGKVRLESSYYMTSNYNLTWPEIEGACLDYYGSNATLLYIETIEEFFMLNIFLSRNRFSSVYWTGGWWNTAQNAFQWLNGVPIGSEWDSMWEEGYPDSETENTKVLINSEFQQNNLRYRTGMVEEPHEFICELDLGEWICGVDNDLVIILDATIQQGGTNFYRGLTFVSDLVDAWFANRGSRISFVISATITTTRIHLNNTLEISEIHKIIEDTYYHATYYPNTHLALNVAFKEFEANPGTNLKNVILVTASESALPSLTAQNAQKLRNDGVEIFAVGVGLDFNPTELDEITGNKSGHVFTADVSSHLVRLLRSVKETIC